MIYNNRQLVEATLAGQRRFSEFVKNPTQTTTAGLWYDLTGSAGNPRAKQWFDAAPLTAQPVRQSTDGGIYHGAAVTPSKKFLRYMRGTWGASAAMPLTMMLCDYLLYYPTVEDGTTDPQVMDNTNPLPRYSTGEGVMMMAVTISGRTGGQSFTVNYTNSEGVAGRTTPLVVQNSAAAPGTITTAATATNNANGSPFIPLQSGDRGVRSIESVTMNGTDTGFFALVLVKPLAQLTMRQFDITHEKDLLIYASELTEIKDDAYLSLLVLPQGSISGVLVRGGIEVTWM